MTSDQLQLYKTTNKNVKKTLYIHKFVQLYAVFWSSGA